jgi:antitoxin component HigA of HigAB toxin-antitoxin module
MSSPKASLAVSHFDARPFFEKALSYGRQHGLIDAASIDAMAQEAPKGMVQIARYFDGEFLRPELEKARERLVNLISLHLEDATAGDVHAAAVLLRDHSLLSRSKAGSDMLKALIVMPQTTHFGMNERGGFTDRHIPQLADWIMKSYAEYRAELAVRQRSVAVVDAALWLADAYGLSVDELQDAAPDAEAVIRTALLVGMTRRKELPDWVGFEKMIASLRDKQRAITELRLQANLPEEFKTVVESVRQSVLKDWPKVLDVRLDARKLFDQTPAFMGRYFWLEDALSEVDNYDRSRSAAWDKLTQGLSDDGTVLTLCLCVASGSPVKTLLSEKAAASLISKIRKSGWQPQLALDYLAAHAPEHLQPDFMSLWNAFVAESQASLLSDRDAKLYEALALLRRECNIS